MRRLGRVGHRAEGRPIADRALLGVSNFGPLAA